MVGGEKGGQALVAPPGRGTRPTSDRAREATFSMLDSQCALEGSHVWDLFCGSGALGIEALSRGAERAIFVDQGRSAVAATRANLAKLGYTRAQATVVTADALSWARSQLPGAVRPDLVFADPPYVWGRWDALLEALSAHQPLVVAETGGELALPPQWQVLRARRYGGTVVTLARFIAAAEPTGAGGN